VTTLADADRDRLTKLLGLLGSDFDGEVAAAGRLANKLVRNAGLGWSDVIAPARPPPDHDRRDDPGADPLHGDWRATATACTRFPHLLNRWETEFLSGLHRFPRLSSKQHAILVRIATRLRAAGCAL
jgi:hypothetical protein